MAEPKSKPETPELSPLDRAAKFLDRLRVTDEKHTDTRIEAARQKLAPWMAWLKACREAWLVFDQEKRDEVETIHRKLTPESKWRFPQLGYKLIEVDERIANFLKSFRQVQLQLDRAEEWYHSLSSHLADLDQWAWNIEVEIKTIVGLPHENTIELTRNWRESVEEIEARFAALEAQADRLEAAERLRWDGSVPAPVPRDAEVRERYAQSGVSSWHGRQAT
jgi:hypothetical protein